MNTRTSKYFFLSLLTFPKVNKLSKKFLNEHKTPSKLNGKHIKKLK